ncbi:hypothetical protein ABIF74_008698 [Bradyrhizobium japonicum]
MFETKTPLPETEAAFLFVLLSSAAAGTELYLSRQNTLTPIPRREELWRNLGDDGVRKAAYRGG